MNKKAFFALTHLPLAGRVIHHALASDTMAIYSTAFRMEPGSEKVLKRVEEFRRNNPNRALTNKVLRRIFDEVKSEADVKNYKTFDEAVATMRNAYPKCYLTNAHVFQGIYVFTLVSKEYREMAFPSGFQAAVDRNGEVMLFDPRMIDEGQREKYYLASQNIIKVDDDEVDIEYIKKKGMEIFEK